MTDYTIQTNFGAKDSLPSGNAAKVVKGSEFTTEFTNIATAVSSKANSAGDTFTGVVNFSDDIAVNTNTLFVDTSTAKVGIGTASPSADLHIKNTSAAQLLIESGETATGFLLFGDASDLNIGSVSYDHSDNSMRFETDDTERMRIDSSGNVGINNDSPATALDVTGVITTDGLTTSAAINLPDDTKINLGASDKLKIYYDPDVGETFQKSRIQTSTDISNALYLQSTAIALTNVDATESYLTALNGSSVSLFYDNGLTLSTKSYGVDIKGTNGASVVAKVEAGDGHSADLKLKNTEGEFDIRCDGGTLDIYDVTDSASRLSFDTSGVATFGNTVRSDVFGGRTNTNAYLVLGKR